MNYKRLIKLFLETTKSNEDKNMFNITKLFFLLSQKTITTHIYLVVLHVIYYNAIYFIISKNVYLI